MERDAITRRLAAILCADVQGYSRMMGADEEGTLRASNPLPRATASAFREALTSRWRASSRLRSRISARNR